MIVTILVLSFINDQSYVKAFSLSKSVYNLDGQLDITITLVFPYLFILI